MIVLRKVLILILFLAGGLNAGAIDESWAVGRHLINFNTIQNWAMSIKVVYIDMFIRFENEIIKNMISKAEKGCVFSRTEIKTTNRKTLDFHKKKEINLGRSVVHYAMFNTSFSPILYGVNNFWTEQGTAGQEVVCIELNETKQDYLLQDKDYYLVVDAGKELIGFKKREPFVFYAITRDFKKSRRIELQENLFIRRAWPVEGGDYLVYHFPFNKGFLFSRVDNSGRVLESFYEIPAPNQNGLRTWFLENFQAASFDSGMLFLTKVFPEAPHLVLEEIDPVNKTITVYKAELEGFQDKHEQLRQIKISNYDKSKIIAAVNGIFNRGNEIFVSFSVSYSHGRADRDFFHYLYVFERGKGFTDLLEIPYGAVVHYHPGREEFISLRDRAVGFNPTFVMFSVESDD